MVLSAEMREEVVRQRVQQQAHAQMQQREAAVRALEAYCHHFAAQRRQCLTPDTLQEAILILNSLLGHLGSISTSLVATIQRWKAQQRGGAGGAVADSAGDKYLAKMEQDLAFLPKSSVGPLLRYAAVPPHLLPPAPKGCPTPPPTGGLGAPSLTATPMPDPTALTPLQQSILEGLLAVEGAGGSALRATRAARVAAHPPQTQTSARLCAGLCSDERHPVRRRRGVPEAPASPPRLKPQEQAALVDRMYYDGIHSCARAWAVAQERWGEGGEAPPLPRRRYRSAAAMAERTRLLSAPKAPRPPSPPPAPAPERRLTFRETDSLIKRLYTSPRCDATPSCPKARCRCHKGSEAPCEATPPHVPTRLRPRPTPMAERMVALPEPSASLSSAEITALLQLLSVPSEEEAGPQPSAVPASPWLHASPAPH